MFAIRKSLPVFVGVFLLLSAVRVHGQQTQPAQPARGPMKPEAQLTAMKGLDYMVGEWKGTGWMDMGPNRVHFRGSEVVQRKLDGVTLLVEGAFFAKPEGSETEIPVHTTLGVISFDPAAQKYRFTTWLATGTSGERELLMMPNGWQWETETPRGRMRYTMTRSEKGEWFEIGERSTDGTNWKKFFEMTLSK